MRRLATWSMLASILVPIMSPAALAGGPHDLRGTQRHFDHLPQPAQVAAKVGFTWHFSGPVYRGEERARFGFALETDAYSRHLSRRQPIPVLGLSIGSGGKTNLSIHGLSVRHTIALQADEEGGDGSVWPWVLGGVAVAGAIVGISAAVTDDNFFEESQ